MIKKFIGITGLVSLLGYVGIGLAATQAINFVANPAQLSGAVNGYCISSVASSSLSAWRCFAGNGVYDPCFVSARNRRGLVCMQSPWDTSATRLYLTKPLTPRSAMQINLKTANPWAIELMDGTRCVYMTGATAPIDGERINYGCNNDNYLYGSVNKSPGTWRIREYNSVTHIKKSAEISKVWN